jgi:hypothetical protein
MGCDIHLYVEKREGDNWVSADTWEQDEGGFFVPYKKQYYLDRNYSLFSILANVRNDHGFIPISEPKGLPKDASREVETLSKGYYPDCHSFSWFTLRELLDYDWTQIATLSGWVSAIEYFRWCPHRKGDGFGPRYFSGGVGGTSVKKITEQAMDEAINEIKNMYSKTYMDLGNKIESLLEHTYCHVTWETPYYRESSGFLSEVIFHLLRLGKPEDVRIVFWFDN